ncbi:hypothetical protein [uncultured Herbaspirillum sp.]|uniref:hypothetical protein n=1 Tax=uncultured Herbaspirillum sp. TaxID=160236 RepID=UPI00258CFA15|nr:hypothetical protein [uncultured Herbaspirillum sp.]
MSSRDFLIFLFFAFFLFPQVSFASEGSIIVRLNDGAGNGRCIDSTDKLTVNLRRMIFSKKSKYFGFVEDQEIGVTLTTTVSGATGDDGRSASFAKIVKAPVSQFRKGQISVPIEQNLLSKFSLKNGENTFTVIDLSVGVVRTQGKSVSAKVLLGAVNATKDLALPINPFTTAYGVATTYVNNIFSPLVDQAASEGEAATHKITMTINSANCANDDERTGTKAIIDAVEDESLPGSVNISKANNYCFKAELSPAFELKFAPRPADGNCNAANNFVEVENSYIAFYVNALPIEIPKPVSNKNTVLAPLASAQQPAVEELSTAMIQKGLPRNTASLFSKGIFSDTRASDVAKIFKIQSSTVGAYRESLIRCQANGVGVADCF